MSEQYAGTMPVQERSRFDVKALERYLRDHIEGFRGPLEVDRFKGGQSTPTFLLRLVDWSPEHRLSGEAKVRPPPSCTASCGSTT